MCLKEKLVDFFINTIGLSSTDANIYADDFVRSKLSSNNEICGKWKKTKSYGTYECSICCAVDTDCSDYYGNHCVEEQKYCPECGEKMKKEA